MRTIAGRYQLEARMGSGGMGTVWKAKDLQLQRIVAIKLLHESLASDANVAERFRREALAAAKLSHPNVVTIYDTGLDDETPFIVMEHVDGPSLHQVLQKRGPLPVEDTARIGLAVLDALDHAHSRGLVHRDIKPDNVLQRDDTWKVADFGIAKGLEDTSGLTRGGIIGTAAYLSPEQASGRQVTPASDIYATGCLLYACLCGAPPFARGTPVAVAMRHVADPVPSLRARRPDLPAGFEAAVMTALAKDPGKRHASAAEMRAALAGTGLHHQDSSEVTLVAAPPTAPIPGPGATEVLTPVARPRRKRRLIAVVAFLAATGLAAAAASFLQPSPPEDGAGPSQQTPAPLPALEPEESPEPTTTPPERPATPRSPATPRPLLQLPGLTVPDQGPQPTPAPEQTPADEDEEDGQDGP